MSDVEVSLPEEQHTLIEYKADDLPAVAIVNSALVRFAARNVFRWHLSILIDFAELIENGMPSEADRELVDPFGEALDEGLKTPPELPNALFLARITWNGRRQLLYRVYDPERANSLLQSVIESRDHPRPFDDRMEDDPDWNHAAWFLDAVASEAT